MNIKKIFMKMDEVDLEKLTVDLIETLAEREIEMDLSVRSGKTGYFVAIKSEIKEKV